MRGMLIQAILFFFVFNSWCSWLILYARLWWRARKEESEELSGFQEFTIVALIAIASMLGILGISWFIRAILG